MENNVKLNCEFLGIDVENPAKAVAERIVSNEHFRKFLLATPKDKRRTAYEAIKPHLKFAAKPYWWLMRKRNNG